MLGKLRLSRAGGLLGGKRVLLRADFNVPLKQGAVADNTRIAETLPTLEAVLRQKPASLVLLSHLGRPNGRPEPEASLRPVAAELARLLGRPVRFLDDCVGAEAAGQLPKLSDGEVVLLENLRFHAEEEGKVPGEKTKLPAERVRAFADRLGSFGQAYVNDAFGTAHRAHASISGIRLPVRMAGLLLERELEFFGRALESPKKPVVIALGGAKVADKLPLVRNLLRLADEILLGGGLAFAFLQALHGTPVGDSLTDAESMAAVAGIAAEAARLGVKLTLPLDLVIAPGVQAAEQARVVSVAEGVPAGWRGLDIGPKTTERFREAILGAGTIIANGPMGAFETAAFARGSTGVVEAMREATRRGALSVVGGGDSVRLVNAVPGAAGVISHVSTGGGASLELLEGKKLPGIEALSNAADFPAL